MWGKRIQRMVEKNRDEFLGILFRKYPDFVLSGRLEKPVGIPAFVFHDISAESLEPMLEFLAENGYATHTADEFVERQVRGERGQEREVLLTFDDGHKSLYTVAYPALKRFGLKAVAYIVPGMTPEGESSRDPEIWGRSLCNWKEIQEMHESRTLDIQSHSMYHHSVAMSNGVVDFVRKKIGFPLLEPYLALPLEEVGVIRKSYGFAYGTPIYDGRARFGDMRAYRESPSMVLACVEYVDRHGGADYFKQPDWLPRLKSVMEEARCRDSRAGFETEAEQRKAILKDLVDSKREIERRLPGKIVRHFSYPWFCGSPLAVQLSAEAGYVSNAWGSLLPSFVHEGHSPIPVPRLASFYIWRLSGKGRKPIGEVLQRRLSQVCQRWSIKSPSVR